MFLIILICQRNRIRLYKIFPSTQIRKEPLIALKTLLYFSIFKYPLTKSELFEFSNINSPSELDYQINYLLEKGVIFKYEKFYTIINDPKLVTRRLKGNEMAKNIMPKAYKVAKFIAKFPYVESVSLSGALSKGYYDDDGDIDFFIITKPNRLWIARTLLVLYKKICLFNSKKYFCVNYFISSNNLKIAERNRFTATEMVTLIPVCGKEKFTAFINQNIWTLEYFPNKQVDFSQIKDIKKGYIPLFLERVFNTALGNFLDDFFRKITLKKWTKKFDNLEKEDFKVAMKSTKGTSKHHPKNFQKTVIDLLNNKYEDIKNQYNLELQQEHA